jgi:hypothetical protein
MSSHAAGNTNSEVVRKPRKTARVSEILDHHLAAYALVAGAAGVSMAALGQARRRIRFNTLRRISISPAGLAATVDLP